MSKKKKLGEEKEYLKMVKMSECLQGVFSSANLERSLLWLDVCVHMCEEREVGMVGEQEVGE